MSDIQLLITCFLIVSPSDSWLQIDLFVRVPVCFSELMCIYISCCPCDDINDSESMWNCPFLDYVKQCRWPNLSQFFSFKCLDIDSINVENIKATLLFPDHLLSFCFSAHSTLTLLQKAGSAAPSVPSATSQRYTLKQVHDSQPQRTDNRYYSLDFDLNAGFSSSTSVFLDKKRLFFAVFWCFFQMHRLPETQLSWTGINIKINPAKSNRAAAVRMSGLILYRLDVHILYGWT